MKRDKSLDIAKGVAIILMMYGHLKYTVQNMDAVYCWIYSFHMPFFMYISGLLTTVKAGNKWNILAHKAQKILLPYVIWNVVGFVINRIFKIGNQTVFQLIHGIVIGDDIRNNLPTWYLVSFFWMTVFAIFILPLLKTTKQIVLIDILAILLVFFVTYYVQIPDYFRWKGAIVLLPFFVTGYLLKKIEFQLTWWLIIPFFLIGYKLSRVNAIQTWEYVTVGNGTIGIPYLYFLSAICTILAMIQTCKILAKVPLMSIIGVYGRHSLLILCTHWVLGNMLGIYMEYGMQLFVTVFIIESVCVGCLELYRIRKHKETE